MQVGEQLRNSILNSVNSVLGKGYSNYSTDATSKPTPNLYNIVLGKS